MMTNQYEGCDNLKKIHMKLLTNPPAVASKIYLQGLRISGTQKQGPKQSCSFLSTGWCLDKKPLHLPGQRDEHEKKIQLINQPNVLFGQTIVLC
jgi:hypothetical protein